MFFSTHTLECVECLRDLPHIPPSLWKLGSCNPNRCLEWDLICLQVISKGSISNGFVGEVLLQPRSSHCVPTNGFVSRVEIRERMESRG